MKKLLITGASGFLGYRLVLTASETWDVTGLYFSHPVNISGINTQKCDLTNQTETENVFKKLSPDAVIHSAAESRPNYCETHPDISYKVNFESVCFLTSLCAEKNIPFVFISTDLVFDGTTPPYSEDSQVSPVNIYGTHKAEAEKAVSEIYEESLICRMPLMFGDPSPCSHSFLKEIYDLLSGKKDFPLFTDEYRSVAGSFSASRGILTLLGKNKRGIFHMGGRESLSRYEFGLKLAQHLGYNPDILRKGRHEDVETPAARPKDVSLLSGKAYSMGYSPLSVTEEFKFIKSLSHHRLS